MVEETVGYLLRDLRRPGGGIASAEDADSEGEEGRFYLWTPAQIHEVLGDDPDRPPPPSPGTGVTEAGNFEARTILNRMHHRGDLLRPDRDRGRPAAAARGTQPPRAARASTTRC